MLTCKRSLFLVIAALMVVSGCAEIRKVTYPPEFVYIEKSELQGSMHRMAAAMGALDTLIATNPTSPSTQSEILAQLDLIEQAAMQLSGGKVITNHLLLDDRMAAFNADVDKARLMAKTVPPDYYYAGRLIGSCIGCHQFR